MCKGLSVKYSVQTQKNTLIMATAQKKQPHLKEGESLEEDIFRESFVFVLDLIQFSEQLKEKKKKSLAKQLLKAGTTFGNVISELRFIEKNEIYTNKIKQLYKNAYYVKYLLQLCLYSPTYPKPNNLIADLDKIIEQIAYTIDENTHKIEYTV